MAKFTQKFILILFGILVLLLPIQTRLIQFIPESHIDQSFIFYNVLFLYISDIILALTLIIWAFSGLFHMKQASPTMLQRKEQESVSHETYNKALNNVGKRNVFHETKLGRLGNVSHETYLWLFFLVSCSSLIVSRQTIGSWELTFFGLFKLFLAVSLFSFMRNIFKKGVFHEISTVEGHSKKSFWGMFPMKQLATSTFWLILATSMFQAGLSIIQYFTQKSVGVKLLGEEVIRNHIPGIAKFIVSGAPRWSLDRLFDVSHGTSILIRPYGTFSHPNIFGAFMFFSALINFYLYVSYGTNVQNNDQKEGSVSRGRWVKGLLSFVLFVQIFAGVISFSRVAIVAFGLSTLFWFVLMCFMGNKSKANVISALRPSEAFGEGGKTGIHDREDRQVRKPGYPIGFGDDKKTKIAIKSFSLTFFKKEGRGLIITLVASGIILSALFYPHFLERGGVVSHGTTNERSISERILYQKISVEMIKQNPLTGVGYKNFVMVMDDYSPQKLQSNQHQPVHNIYLLIAAETGLPALIIFLIFIITILKQAWWNRKDPLIITLLSIFIGFLFIGLFDHYLLTIQQGRLMFFLTAGLLAVSSKIAVPAYSMKK
ncbi:MAG: hypothetical protein COT91_05515 [Candidatus Doudnabacteria bacterium CG10_big_fil_rev_8_21_14_0_10_41_10]|uniref:O-antigen ligase-related domain-containing protein n=1 Tax=Candidatus Doudnabacteria bacterium CG10_big_fil_rev_8_21_14_0_10_41_10 TaxID=1974551 RepID=A0A2H0VC50_9BACT|nr:MAG: hypothetical protein COT91_05515 [Candidatus Doudnabacteria bacterium CG10_big_fil_rev_8_21_14_0_10_41_10]